MLLCNWLRLTRSKGKARYQNPVSIRESGASRLSESGVDMDESQRNTASKPVSFANGRRADLGGAGLEGLHEKTDNMGFSP